MPAGVSAGTPNETTVTITDDDDPAVTASFGKATYAVDEGSTVAVRVTLSYDPERSVTIPLTKVAQGGVSIADYSGVPASLTFAAGDTEKTITFRATADRLDDDDESVKLTFGTLPAGVSAGTPNETTVTITDDDDPAVTASFGKATYAVDEGSTVAVRVTLSYDPERSVTIPLTKVAQGGVSIADYSGVPASLTFATGDTAKTFTFSATADDLDDDGESVKLTFGTLPDGVSAGTPNETTVTITDDDDPAVTASFGKATYAVDEGSTVAVRVTLSYDPERSVTIPLTKVAQGGVSIADYSGVPASLTFAAGDTEKTITFSATADRLDDDDESVKLTFGTLPAGVSAGTPNETTVTITDDDDPAVTVSFGKATYAVDEGSTVAVRVTLSYDPERSVTIPLTKVAQGGVSIADYSGVPASLTFAAGDTEKTITFSATADRLDDDDESVKLTFGTLPAGVSAGTPNETTVTITDDDDPAVTASFGKATYAVDEGSTVAVRVTLSYDPERSVTIPLTKVAQGGVSIADYSGVPASLTFAAGDTEKTITFSATADRLDDDDESVKLTFGTLPAGVSAGTPNETTVTITDDDDPAVTASFASATYTVAEGGTVEVQVTLSYDPERSVTIPLTKVAQGGVSIADYSGVPASLTFAAGDTEKTITFSATADRLDDDDESVKLTFGTLPAGVSAGTPNETTVTITDDDDPAVTVSFGKATYAVDEGSTVAVRVTLSYDPERSVTIPLTKVAQGGVSIADYSGVPASLTFAAGDTEKTITFSATADRLDDDDESVKLTFGTLPAGVSAGTPNETTVTITDDDDPAVTVSFGKATYAVDEGSTVAVRVTLSYDPERSVTIPLTKVAQGGVSIADYSGVPASLTFAAGDTEKTITFSATADRLDDDDESVKLTFGTLPAGVSAGTPNETTVTITGVGWPAARARARGVTVTPTILTIAEGATGTYRVVLDTQPSGDVTIMVASDNTDVTCSPEMLIFTRSNWNTAQMVITNIKKDDDVFDETAKIRHAASGGDYDLMEVDEVDVTIIDGNIRGVTVTRQVTLALDSDSISEDGGVSTVTATLDRASSEETTVTVSASAVSPAVSGDYTLSGNRILTIAAGATASTGAVTLTAVDNQIDAPDKTVAVSAMASNSQGASAPADMTLTIIDDDDPAVTVSFGKATYAVDEGGTVAVRVTLSYDPERSVTIPLTKVADPERSVTIPLSRTAQRRHLDYSGVPASLVISPSATA